MKVTCIHSIKRNGAYLAPGATIDLEKNEANRLIRLGVVQEFIEMIEKVKEETIDAPSVDEKVSPSPELVIAELAKIKGVSEKLAIAMYEGGITSIELLSSLTPKELNDMPILGIGKAKARQIIDEVTFL